MAVVERRYFCEGSPIKSTIAIGNGDFRLCGIIMGMSILQGGPAPNFMTHAVSCFFTGCEMLTSDVKNIAYQDIVTRVSFCARMSRSCIQSVEALICQTISQSLELRVQYS